MPRKKSPTVTNSQTNSPKPSTSSMPNDFASPAVPSSPTLESNPPDNLQVSPRPNARRVSTSKILSLENVKAGITAIYENTDEEGISALFELLFHLSQYEPALNNAEWEESVTSRIDQERKIIERDPTTVKEVIDRIRNELDEIFEKLEGEALYKRFFKVEDEKPERPKLRSLAATEAKWLERWLTKNPTRSKNIIGFMGEYLVFSMLRKVVPNFNEDAWTSTYRKHVFPDRPIPKVQPGIPGKPDFVFQDESGILAGLLLEDRASQAKTFCLEVKTSPDTPRAFATESQSKAIVDLYKTPSPDIAYVVIPVEDASDLRCVRINCVCDNLLKKMIEGWHPVRLQVDFAKARKSEHQ